MKSFEMKVRVIALVTMLCCLAGLGSPSVQAQSVTVSPSNLSFGVPTGSTMSAPQIVNLSFTGSGSVTGISATISPMNPESGDDFLVTGNTCGAALTAPATCSVAVTFTPSLSAGTLETARLSLASSASEVPVLVNLTGALGAIKLFDPLNVAQSTPRPGLSDDNPTTFASTNVIMSCPDTTPTGSLSSRPDNHGNVLVDNFVTLAVNGHSIDSGIPAGNVCRGGQNEGGGGQQDCFTTNYQVPAGASALDGLNPDTFTNAGNPILSPQPPNGDNAGGVLPIDVSASFSSNITQKYTFSLLDGGGKVTSSSLFLVTNCTPINIQTGSVTGNPIDATAGVNASQTFTFDSVPNHLDQYAFDYSFAAHTIEVNSAAVPVITNNSIPTGAYPALVTGTPFASTACIPANSLNGNCGGKTQVCTPVPPATGEASGANCPQSREQNILLSTTFDPTADALANINLNLNSVFGFLEFNDAGTCPLEGPSASKSCPQNQLVDLYGPGELTGRRGTGSTNSTGVLVTGIIPPSTMVAISPFFSTGPSSGWTNASPSATFTGKPAASGSVVAPIDFIEFGTNPVSQGLPPNFPLPFPGNAAFTIADTVFTNTSTCPTILPATAPFFTPASVQLGQFTDGSSNLLHYATTDCAGTHELKFSFSGGPSGKWSTSFKSLTLNVDTVPPDITITTPPINGTGTYSANQKVKSVFSCTDSESGVTAANCTGPSYIDTTPNGPTIVRPFTVNAVDNVLNSTSRVVNYTVTCHYAAIGVRPTTITRPAFINVSASVIDCVSAPQTVSVKFTLSGPLGMNCGNSSTVMFTTPPFTIKSGTSSSISFPFPITRSVCAGVYTITTTTMKSGSPIDTTSATLTVN